MIDPAMSNSCITPPLLFGFDEHQQAHELAPQRDPVMRTRPAAQRHLESCADGVGGGRSYNATGRLRTGLLWQLDSRHDQAQVPGNRARLLSDFTWLHLLPPL